MNLNALLKELKGISTGDPDYISSTNPQEVRHRALAIISSIFEEFGFENLTGEISVKNYVFDLIFSSDLSKFGLDLKFGRVTQNDISRYKVMMDASRIYISKLIILCTDISENVDDVYIEGHIELQIITLDQFINLLSLPRGSGVQYVYELVRTSPNHLDYRGISSKWEDEVRQYIISTFGHVFFSQISKDSMSLSLFSQNRTFLGNRSPTIILAGTTNTGKSTIANVLFGEKVVDTAPYTDKTGEIAKIELPNGLLIYDTPGVGGMNDKFENITRCFLGLPQIVDLNKIKEIPIVDLSNITSPKKITQKDAIQNVNRCIVLLVFDLVGGFKRADFDLLKMVQGEIPRTLLIGNKMDLVKDEDLKIIQEDINKRIGIDFVSIASKPRDGSHPYGMDKLVQKICYQLSEDTIIAFNDQLVSKYKREENKLTNTAIKKAAAKAAVVRPGETIPGGSLPILQALLLGLVLRLGVDLEVGGKKVKQDIVTSIKHIYLQVASSSTEKEVVLKDETKRVKRWRDTAPEGALAGGALGASLGAIGGPIGMLFGAIIGGLLGTAVGAGNRIKQFVTELWTVPDEEVVEAPGGANAAIATMAFGFALNKVFTSIREEEISDFDPRLFTSEINTSYQRFDKLLTDYGRNELNNTKLEKTALAILEGISL